MHLNAISHFLPFGALRLSNGPLKLEMSYWNKIEGAIWLNWHIEKKNIPIPAWHNKFGARPVIPFGILSWGRFIMLPEGGASVNSGVSIIADVAESIAETKPISINRIEIWDWLIVKKQYSYEFTKYELLLTRIHFNIHWQRWRRPVRRRQRGWRARNTSLSWH